jgi:hypothetical protein
MTTLPMLTGYQKQSWLLINEHDDTDKVNMKNDTNSMTDYSSIFILNSREILIYRSEPPITRLATEFPPATSHDPVPVSEEPLFKEGPTPQLRRYLGPPPRLPLALTSRPAGGASPKPSSTTSPGPPSRLPLI